MVRTWRYISTQDSLKSSVKVIANYLRQVSGTKRPMLAVDLETYRPDGNTKLIPKPVWNGHEFEGRIRTLQIGLDPTNPEWKIGDIQFIIDVDRLGEALVSAALKELIEGPTWLMQNGKYDLPFFAEFLKIKPRHVVDTMLISQCYWSGDRLNHSLGDNYENFIGRVAPGLFKRMARPMFWYWYKEKGWSKERFKDWYSIESENELFKMYKGFKSILQRETWKNANLSLKQLQYGADDVRLIFYLYNAQQEAILGWQRDYEQSLPIHKGLKPTINLELSIMPIYSKMERFGIKHDGKYHREYLIPLMDRKVERARRECAKFPELRKRRKKGENSLTFIHLDGEPKVNEGKWVKTLIQSIYPDIKELKVHKKKSGPSTLALVSWKDGPTRAELLPTARSILSADKGWKFRDDRTIHINTDEVKIALSKALGEKVLSRDEKYLKTLIDPKDPNNPKYGSLYAVLEYLKAFNYASKYGRGMLKYIRPNGYAYPNWNQLGSEHSEIVSGRSSVKDPPIMIMAAREQMYAQRGRKGILAAKLIRPMWVAEDDCTFVCADYSRIEPCYTAESTKDKTLCSVFLEGRDQHGLTAQYAWNALQELQGGELLEEPPTGGWLRDFGKLVNLGMTYGLSIPGLAGHLRFNLFGKMLPPTEEEAEAIWHGYWDLYSGVLEVIDKIEAKCTSKLRRAGSLAPFKGRKPFGVIRTARGRHRRFCLTPEQERAPNHVLHKDFEGWYCSNVLCNKEGDHCGHHATNKDKKKRGLRYHTRWSNFYSQRLRDVRLKAFNHTIQGTCADMLKLAELYLDRAIAKRGWDESKNHIKIVMHDELVVQCEVRYVKQMKRLVDKCMRRAATKFLKKIPVEVQIGVGKNWYEAGANAKGAKKKAA